VSRIFEAINSPFPAPLPKQKIPLRFALSPFAKRGTIGGLLSRWYVQLRLLDEVGDDGPLNHARSRPGG